MSTTTRRRLPARFRAHVAAEAGSAPTPALPARGERWHEVFLPGEDSPAQRRQAELTELDELRAERSTLLGRIDVEGELLEGELEGELATMRRERVAHFEQGVREGNRPARAPVDHLRVTDEGLLLRRTLRLLRKSPATPRVLRRHNAAALRPPRDPVFHKVFHTC